MKPILETAKMHFMGVPVNSKPRTIRTVFDEGSRLVFGSRVPDLAAAEQYRTIARRLRARFPQGAVFAVTSPAQGEGKTLTAANLALAFGEDAQSTLLVDMDLRCPAVHERLSIQFEPTINKVLSGEATTMEAVRLLDGRNLHVCVAAVDAEPAKLVSRQNLETLVDELREKFTYIVLDTPPIFPAGDILEVAGVSDAVLLVVREGHTEVDVLQRAMERLSGTLCGVILNDSSLDDAAARYASRYHQGS